MENKEEDLENLEIISLCDLQKISEGNESPEVPRSPQDSFEFFTESSDSENYTFSDIIFCGRIISHENDTDNNSSPFFRSNSFRRPTTTPTKQNRACSARFHSSQSLERVVNISGLTSMSAKSRRRMFMFGPVKFKPEMELSEIKQRQERHHRRCAPPLMPVVPFDDGGGKTTARVKKSKGGPTGKLMELTSRSPFVNVLAKSLSCFSMPKHCMVLP